MKQEITALQYHKASHDFWVQAGVGVLWAQARRPRQGDITQTAPCAQGILWLLQKYLGYRWTSGSSRKGPWDALS